MGVKLYATIVNGTSYGLYLSTKNPTIGKRREDF